MPLPSHASTVTVSAAARSPYATVHIFRTDATQQRTERAVLEKLHRTVLVPPKLPGVERAATRLQVCQSLPEQSLGLYIGFASDVRGADI